MPIAPVNSNINQVNFNKNRDKKVKKIGRAHV